MMNEIKESTAIFDDIKHIDEFGVEYWNARELMPLLEYKKWENFHNVIKEAMITCENSGYQVSDCFPDERKSIISGKGRISYIKDYNLNRYACYLIVQNGDP